METNATGSPLLHGQQTGTPLDLITERLYFIWPLTDEQVEWLNTVIYRDSLFHINYWSLTHTFFGFLWGMAGFPLFSFIVFHSLFELWELWAGGYLSGRYSFTSREIADVISDTLFGVIGYWLGSLGLMKNAVDVTS